MARHRRLLPATLLEEIQKSVALGIPLVKIFKQYKILCSYTSFYTLVIADKLVYNRQATRPKWSKDIGEGNYLEGNVLRTPPLGWKFVGDFPSGYWTLEGVRQSDDT